MADMKLIQIYIFSCLDFIDHPSSLSLPSFLDMLMLRSGGSSQKSDLF